MKKILGFLFVALLSLATISKTQALSCTQEYKPVCGEDGKTYSNACMLWSATRPGQAMKIVHEGPCDVVAEEPMSEYVPTPDCIRRYDGCNTCEAGKRGTMCTLRFCQESEKTQGYCIEKKEDSPLPQYPEGCLERENNCEKCVLVGGDALSCTPKSCSFEGETVCTKHKNQQVKIPNGCIGWFDGCNDCSVQNGRAVACTERACLRKEEAYCRTYDHKVPSVNIPQYCSLRYDGCNNCTVKDGQISACTRRACIHQDTPKCLNYDYPQVVVDPKPVVPSYDYQYLNEFAIRDIEKSFQRFMSRYDRIQQLYVVKTMKLKLAELIREKEYFLARARLTEEAYVQNIYVLEIYKHLLFLIENVY